MQTAYTQLTVAVTNTETITIDVSCDGIRFTLVKVENNIAHEKDHATLVIKNGTRLELN